MSSAHLLQALAATYQAQQRDPRTGNLWDSWKCFKLFVRLVNEVPEPGVSVQYLVPDEGAPLLVFARQVLEPDNDALEPAGAVACEFELSEDLGDLEWDLWSFDFREFDDFVAAVEADDRFIKAVSHPPRDAWIRWIEA
jgi:hypothetical protein